MRLVVVVARSHRAGVNPAAEKHSTRIVRGTVAWVYPHEPHHAPPTPAVATWAEEKRDMCIPRIPTLTLETRQKSTRPQRRNDAHSLLNHATWAD